MPLANTQTSETHQRAETTVGQSRQVEGETVGEDGDRRH